MLSPKELRALFERHGLAPRKSLGQNFLIDANLARKLIDASGVGAGDRVLEVGPGAGALTEGLLERGCRVLACELDEGLADVLEERFGAESRFTLLRGDCLDGKRAINPALRDALAGEPYTLVANLPYNAATPLAMTLLLREPACRSLWITVQREVADRLRAAPGSKEYGEISVVARVLAEITHVATLGPACFWPRPSVESSMIGLTRRAEPMTHDADRLQTLCRMLFAQRRKQLGSILRNAMRGRDWPAGIEPMQRPESLGVEEFEALASTLAEEHDEDRTVTSGSD